MSETEMVRMSPPKLVLYLTDSGVFNAKDADSGEVLFSSLSFSEVFNYATDLMRGGPVKEGSE